MHIILVTLSDLYCTWCSKKYALSPTK